VTDLLGPAYVSARWGYYLAALLTIGASSFAPFLFGRRTALARRFPGVAQRLYLRAVALGRLGSSALVGFGLLRLWFQSRTLLEPGEPLTSEFVGAVLTTGWGQGWQRQLAAAIVTLVGFLAAPTRRLGWILALIGTVLLLAGLAACRPLDSECRPEAVRLLVGHFSRRALIAAPLTVGFGVWLSARYLGWTWPLRFFQTSYGWALAGKIALVLGVLALGALNWRLVQPRLAEPGGEARFRRSGGAELGLAVLVLGVTAVLVALSFSEHGG
jgi:putative copper export protein